MKRNAKKGFTLAELLIVVAILAILVAIMMPVFGAQLNKARAAADLANIRSKYSELVAEAMLGDDDDLTADVAGAVSIDVDKLVSDVKYECTVIITPGSEDTNGSIKVQVGTTNTITGSFDTDPDVSFKDGETTLTAGTEATYKVSSDGTATAQS